MTPTTSRSLLRIPSSTSYQASPYLIRSVNSFSASTSAQVLYTSHTELLLKQLHDHSGWRCGRPDIRARRWLFPHLIKHLAKLPDSFDKDSSPSEIADSQASMDAETTDDDEASGNVGMQQVTDISAIKQTSESKEASMTDNGYDTDQKDSDNDFAPIYHQRPIHTQKASFGRRQTCKTLRGNHSMLRVYGVDKVQKSVVPARRSRKEILKTLEGWYDKGTNSEDTRSKVAENGDSQEDASSQQEELRQDAMSDLSLDGEQQSLRSSSPEVAPSSSAADEYGTAEVSMVKANRAKLVKELEKEQIDLTRQIEELKDVRRELWEQQYELKHL